MRGFRASLLAAALVLLTGCAPPLVACPAILYLATAYVELDDPRPGLTLELCDGAGCTPGPVEAPVEIGATSTPIETGVSALRGSSATGWTATLLAGQPVLGYRLTDAAGTVVAEGEVDADWVRIDGDDRCGGNREARIVIPA